MSSTVDYIISVLHKDIEHFDLNSNNNHRFRGQAKKNWKILPKISHFSQFSDFIEETAHGTHNVYCDNDEGGLGGFSPQTLVL